MHQTEARTDVPNKADWASWITPLLRVTCVLLFLGRAWQHLRWDAPFRALLWSQDTMEAPVRFFLGLDWNTYATNPATEAFIRGLIHAHGGFYLLCAVAAALCTPSKRWTHWLLFAGALSLFFLSYLYYRDKIYRLGEWGEYACQFALPVLLVLSVRGVSWENRIRPLIRIAVALTFACHGLYAIGFYPTPGEWTTMVMMITRLGEDSSLLLIRVAGALDFLAAALLFFARWERPAVLYAFAWGLLTALARSVAFIRWDNFSESTAQWLHETIIRLPHAVLPLVLLIALPWNVSAIRRWLPFSLPRASALTTQNP